MRTRLGLIIPFAAAALSLAAVARAVPPASGAADDALRRECREAMLKATRFMVDRASTQGGYLWRYLPDLSRRWGEMEAYETQIAVQPPGTTSMGQLFLDAYRATGDEAYYDAAEQAARALAWGQLECGGWNYLIDFGGERSLRHWYDTIGRNGWRLEEHQHYHGNATFDDNVSSDATRLMLRMYLEKLDPAFRYPLDKAIRFVLESQYANGGWPQRYPPRLEARGDGEADYASFVTFNDGVVWENVRLLLQCHLSLGEPRFLDPIRRGMDVYVLTQLKAPQAGWAEQYTLDLKPAGARTYEPAGVLPSYTAEHVRLLIHFYRLTGERKYLARIPEALDWLDRCRLPSELTEGGRFTHPAFVEIGTDRPLFVHRVGSNVVNGRYYVDHEAARPASHIGGGGRLWIDVASLRRAYEEASALSPAEAMKDSPLQPGRVAASRPPWVLGTRERGFVRWFGHRPDLGEAQGLGRRPDETQVRQVIAALDSQGRWLTRHEMTSHPYAGDGQPGTATDEHATTFVGDETDTSPFYDPSDREYVSTAAYIRNMRILIDCLQTAAQGRPAPGAEPPETAGAPPQVGRAAEQAPPVRRLADPPPIGRGLPDLKNRRGATHED